MAARSHVRDFSAPGADTPASGAPGEARRAAQRAARYVGTGALYVLTYLALDWISYIHAWSIFGFTLWNPPPALSLALVLIRGPAYVPFIFIAAVAADQLVRHTLLGVETSILSAFVLTVGYGGLATLLRRFGPIDLLRGSMRDVLILLLAVPAGIFCVATGFVVGFWSLGFFLPGDYMRAVTAFWIGDVSGILALLPFLLIALDPERRWRRRLAGAAGDMVMFVLMLSASLWLIFGAGFANELRFFYLLFIPIIWIAIRRGITGAALGVLAVQSCVAAAVLLREYPVGTFQAFQTFFIMIDATGLLLGAAVTARYLAELQLQKHQAQADHVARITTVGIMGSALAHQISQPLASIATNAHTATLLLEANEAVPRQVRTALAQIASETERAGQVLRQLRDFIAEGRIDLRQIDIADVVHRVAALVRRQNALVPVSLAVQAPRGLTVYADAMQLEQVLLNVVNNAIEATLASGPLRTVSIAARAAGESIEITVEDEGGGIEPELAGRLFEPFVTTKSHGMGLGLAICRTIVEAHDGTIGFEARPHGGTRFAIRIPRA